MGELQVSLIAVYFFIAGIVSEHSSSNKYKELSSPILPIIRGFLWPLVFIFWTFRVITL